MNAPKYRKTNCLLALASVVSLTAALPAMAGFSQGNNVTMGGQPVFKIDCSAQGFSASHRAWLAQDALDNALVASADRSPSAVTVNRLNGAYVVELGGQKVATADADSAKAEGISAEQLASRWADQIRNFLSDSEATAQYVATLKDPNKLQADVAFVEKQLYAAPGTVLPVAFLTEVNCSRARAGDRIEAKLSSDVPMGNYVIPEKSILIGELVETAPGTLGATFNTLRTPSGTECAIQASATETYVSESKGPHPVLTMGMPANAYAGCRVPATVAVGSAAASGQTRLVLNTRTERVIAQGQPFQVILENPAAVAVTTRNSAM